VRAVLPPFLRIKPICYDFGLVVVGACFLLSAGGFHRGMFAVIFSMGSSLQMTPICLIPPLEPNPGIQDSFLGLFPFGLVFRRVLFLERNQLLQATLGTKLPHNVLLCLVSILPKPLAEFKFWGTGTNCSPVGHSLQTVVQRSRRVIRALGTPISSGVKCQVVLTLST
jgi:hypothetical protein